MIHLSCCPERLLRSSSAVRSSVVSIRGTRSACYVLPIGFAGSSALKTPARFATPWGTCRCPPWHCTSPQTAVRLPAELTASIQTAAEYVAERPNSSCAISVEPITPSPATGAASHWREARAATRGQEKNMTILFPSVEDLLDRTATSAIWKCREYLPQSIRR